MSRDDAKLIGFLIGREREFPEAVMAAVNEQHEGMQCELVKLGGTFVDDPVPYDVIIDRMSHEIPYYRTYVKYACLNGCYVINNPFVWSNDTKFFAGALLEKMGIRTPRTVVLPNKDVEAETVPDSFRNLEYPMDWQAIIELIGAPAIFKDVRSGGRRFAHRVSSVDELIQRYDESGTRTMILQQVIESDQQYHCAVIGQEQTLLMRYSMDGARYLDEPETLDEAQAREMTDIALRLTRLYDYDINFVEFVLKDGDVYVINTTNPSPLINHELVAPAQFDWLVAQVADLAVKRALAPVPQRLAVELAGF